MKTKGFVIILVFAVLFVIAIGLRADPEALMRTSDGKRITLKEALPDLIKARVIFVGELHDRKSHHDAQLDVIRLLKESDARVAIGLEMFQKQSQQQLDEWVSGTRERI